MVVTDVHCARSMTGLELARRLRIHTRTTTVPIIVLTSKMRRQDGELSVKAGADMFLEKPVSGDVLRDRVARLLVADARPSRRLSPEHELPGFAADDAARDRSCPQCCGLMEYRHKAPVLSSELNSRQPRDRLRYVSGWFCSDPSCEYRELWTSGE